MTAHPTARAGQQDPYPPLTVASSSADSLVEEYLSGNSIQDNHQRHCLIPWNQERTVRPIASAIPNGGNRLESIDERPRENVDELRSNDSPRQQTRRRESSVVRRESRTSMAQRGIEAVEELDLNGGRQQVQRSESRTIRREQDEYIDTDSEDEGELSAYETSSVTSDEESEFFALALGGNERIEEIADAFLR